VQTKLEKFLAARSNLGLQLQTLAFLAFWMQILGF